MPVSSFSGQGVQRDGPEILNPHHRAPLEAPAHCRRPQTRRTAASYCRKSACGNLRNAAGKAEFGLVLIRSVLFGSVSHKCGIAVPIEVSLAHAERGVALGNGDLGERLAAVEYVFA